MRNPGVLHSLRYLAVAATAALAASASPCLAGSGASQGPSLSDVRDAERYAEAQHTRKLREIDERLQAQTLDSDTALMMRSQAENDYRREMANLRRAEDEAIRGLEASQRPRSPGDGERAPTAALPRIESQSVIEYGTPSAPEKPQKEGTTHNVGLGVREVEF